MEDDFWGENLDFSPSLIKQTLNEAIKNALSWVLEIAMDEKEEELYFQNLSRKVSFK